MKRIISIAASVIFLTFLCLLYIHSTTWFRLLLTCYYARQQNEEQMIIAYKKIIRKENVSTKYRTLPAKDLADIHFELFRLLFKKKRLKESLDFLKILAHFYPRYKDFLPLGNQCEPLEYKKAGLCLLRAGFIDAAIVYFQEYLKDTQEESFGYYQLGFLYQKKEKVNKAIKQYFKSLAIINRLPLKPGYESNIYLQLGKAAEQLNNFKIA